MTSLVYVRKHDNSTAPQKWRVKQSDLVQTYSREVVVQIIQLPPEEEEWTIDSLVAKYGYPQVRQ